MKILSSITHNPLLIIYFFRQKNDHVVLFCTMKVKGFYKSDQINHHISGAYVAQIDISYSTFVLFDTIHFIV